MVRYPLEKKGGNSFSQSRCMELFSDFFNINELIDLPLREIVYLLQQQGAVANQ